MADLSPEEQRTVKLFLDCTPSVVNIANIGELPRQDFVWEWQRECLRESHSDWGIDRMRKDSSMIGSSFLFIFMGSSLSADTQINGDGS